MRVMGTLLWGEIRMLFVPANSGLI
jgi:hypothetical protein